VERYRVRTVAIDDPQPLLALLPDSSALVWLRQGEGMVAWGEAGRVEVGSGPQRFPRAARRLAALFERADVEDEVRQPGTGPVAFGSFTFDPEVGDSILTVPRVVVGRRGGTTWLTRIGAPEILFPPEIVVTPPADRVRYAGSSMPDVHWLEAVSTAIDTIAAGAYDKVVLARDYAVWSKSRFDARTLLGRLAERFPECFTFACAGLVGATPELLVRRTDRHVESLVLAGSAPRGPDPATDATLGSQLLESKKDRGEHDLAVASVHDVLADRAELAPAADAKLLRLANVQHLATRVTGRLHDPPPTALELAGALHPSAAVCGTPTRAAMDAIRALEGMDRGRYSGPVGWVDARGDGEWGIALRCAQLSGARARLFAGAGIVEGSLPEAELEETRLKLNAMQAAFQA
jgi:menaquinone-specific isochorismate synthase